MFDLIEQPVDEPELSAYEQAALDRFERLKETRIEETVVDRMLDPEWVIDAIQVCLKDNIDTQTRMALLIMGHGDKNILIANLKLDVMDWIRYIAKKEAERGML